MVVDLLGCNIWVMVLFLHERLLLPVFSHIFHGAKKQANVILPFPGDGRALPQFGELGKLLHKPCLMFCCARRGMAVQPAWRPPGPDNSLLLLPSFAHHENQC